MHDMLILDTQTKSPDGLLMLEGIDGIGRVAIAKLVERFSTFGEVLDADDETLKTCLNVKQRESIRNAKTLTAARRLADKTVARAAETETRILTIYDEEYPERLLTVEKAPFVIYVSGNLDILRKSLAFVGTREPTDFGGKVARAMATPFAEEGWCVVSGLARGVDSICHQAAIDAKGTTCAVLASGIDKYNGAAAMQLAQLIDEKGGVIITEQPYGADANQGSYIARDRLITGLSAATFVIQGTSMLTSGTMHSIRYAVTQGKPVYVPNIPDRYRHEPLNELVMNLARLTLGQMAAKYEWAGKVMDVVNADPDRSAAEVIMNRGDYPFVFSQLEALLPEMKPQAEAPRMAMPGF